jgi:hypothetical protein
MGPGLHARRKGPVVRTPQLSRSAPRSPLLRNRVNAATQSRSRLLCHATSIGRKVSTFNRSTEPRPFGAGKKWPGPHGARRAATPSSANPTPTAAAAFLDQPIPSLAPLVIRLGWAMSQLVWPKRLLGEPSAARVDHGLNREEAVGGSPVAKSLSRIHLHHFLMHLHQGHG